MQMTEVSLAAGSPPAMGHDSQHPRGKAVVKSVLAHTAGLPASGDCRRGAQEIRQLPAVKAYMVRYPGYTVMPVGYHDFPLWLRRGGFLAAAAFY